MTDRPSNSRQHAIFQVVTTRPVAVLCVVAAFLVFGIVSLGKLPTTLMPNLEYPQLTVRTSYPAAAPAEVEEKVSQRIEERLGNVPGLIYRSSISRAESSDVILKFAWGTNMLETTADVRDRLDRIGFDDDEVQRPQILRYDPAQDPTMRLVLFATGSDVDLLELRSFAEDILKPELAKIEGVAAVRVSGGEERQIRIALSESRLNQYGLTAQQVVQRLRAARVDSSAGIIELSGRDVIVRVVSTYDSLEVLRSLEVAAGDQGRVTLADVAPEIGYQARERETVTRFAGPETRMTAREGVLLEVLKEGDANIIETAKKVWIALYGQERYEAIRDSRGEQAPAGPGEVQMQSRGGGQGAVSPRGAVRGGARGGGGRGGGGGGSFFVGKRSLVDQLPQGFGLKVVSDQSYFIEDAVEDVTASAILGALLAVLVLFFFLRSVKATVLIAASIPLSIMTTFIPLQLSSVSLNLMSLGGLALGVGMLVDNSVVVLESIARCKEEGDDNRTAAIRGISEVGGAIFASTMTTVAVFFPIVFVEGVAGQIFRDLSLTVVFSLLASLVVAQFVVPAMFALGFGGVAGLGAFRVTKSTARYMVPESGLSRGRLALFVLNRIPQVPFWLVALLLVAVLDAQAFVGRYIWRGVAFVMRWVFKPMGWLFQAGWAVLDRTYPLVLRAALAQPAIVLAAALLSAVVGVSMAAGLQTELLPRFQQDEFYADIAAPEGTQIKDTDSEGAALIKRAFEREDVTANVSRITQESGGEEQAGDSRPVGSHRVRFVVTLKRNAVAAEVLPVLEEAFRELADESTLFQGSTEYDAPALVKIDAGLEIEVRGSNHERLARAAATLVSALQQIQLKDGRPLLTDVRSSLQAGRPQVQLVYDRSQLQRFGLSAEQVTSEARNKIGGEVSTQFRSAGEDLEVLVELLSADKANLDRVKGIEVARGVRLRDVLVNGGNDLRVTEGPSEIRRVGNQRAVVIFAQPNGVALGTAADMVDELLREGGLSLEDAEVGFAGQVQEMESSILSLGLALLLALFLVYVVMAVQFESLMDPLVIMFAVPFAGVGVVVALWFYNLPVSVMVLLGSIVLAGIVVNNAIVLVSYANQLLGRGQAPREAALNASRIRLRPIAITTLTTLLGLLPMTGWLDPFMPAVKAVAEGMDTGIAAAVEGMGRSLTAPKDWKLIGGWKFSLGTALGKLVGGGEGAEVRKPLAITVIAGLASSTILTLIVIPALWCWVNSLRRPKVIRVE